MRKLIYYVAATPDGFIASPDGDFQFFPVEADMIEWVTTHCPETLPAHVRRGIGIDELPNKMFDTLVMGRGTYQPALDLGIASPYPHLRQYVFAHGLEADGVTVVDGDPVAVVRGLKAEDGLDVWLAGGGVLAAQLIDEIDELMVKVSPVLAGAGIPILPRAFDPRPLTLTSAEPLPSGVVVLRYRTRYRTGA